MLRHERKIWKSGIPYIAGIDEAGRGPLAGPVVAAAVVASPGFFLPEVNDSKQLTAAVRERLYEEILKGAQAVGIGIVDHDTIDRVNILNATFLAMHRAIAQLSIQPGHLLVDGNRFRQHLEHVPSSVLIPFTLLVGGDARCFSIAAASIIAKVTRDRLMVEYDRQFPGYEFARHKGYPTPQHRAAITRLGLSPIHRRSFAHPSQFELDLPGH